MKLDFAEFPRLCAVLHAALQGSILQEVRQPQRSTVVLSLRSPGETHQLVLQLDSRHPAAYLGKRKWGNAPTPSGFTQKCRKELLGARAVAVAGMDGVGGTSEEPALPGQGFALHLRRGEQHPLGAASFWLVVDLHPGHPNAVLRDANGGSIAQVFPSRHASEKPEEIPDPLVAARPENTPEPLPDGEAATWMAQLEDAWHLATDKQRADAELRQLRQAARSLLAKLTRKAQKIEGDLLRAEEAPALLRRAELLKAALPTWQRGVSVVDAVDWFDPSLQHVRIVVDPSVEPRALVAALFRRARRLEAAREHILERSVRLSTDTALVQRLVEELSAGELTADDRRTLEARAKRLGVRPQQVVAERPSGSAKSPADARLAAVCRVFEAEDGTTILVGKGAKENDTLTLRVARSDDIWLHATGRTGAHVILRCAKDCDPNPAALEDAAVLAAWYAEGGKSETGVEVAYTRRKYVNKRKGLPPGAVTYSRIKTLFVVPSKERVDRLFGREGEYGAG